MTPSLPAFFRLHTHFLLWLSFLLLGITSARGQVLRYWDINGATAGAGGATPSGTWDASTANWNNTAAGTGTTSAWANTGLETAVFAAGGDATGAYTVTLGAGAPLNLSGIAVNLGSITLQPLGANDGLNFGTVNAALAIASGSSLTIAAPVSGSAGLTKSGLGTVTVSGADTFTGATTLAGGNLVLDFTAQNNSKLDAASGLVLGGGTLSLTPNATADTVQTVSATALNLGSSTLVVNKNAASNNATFNLNTITQSSGGTLNIIYGGSGTGAASATTNNTNTNGILGGWATVNGTSWAVNSTNAANGPVTALASYVSDTLAAGNNTDITITGANPAAGALTANSLRFNQLGAKTLALSTGVKTISGGGILVTANVGSFITTLSGSNLQAPSGKDFIISQYNPSADLNVTAVIQTAGGGGVVKTGPGVLDLGGANTFTGAVTVDQGFLGIGTVANNGTASNLGAGTVLNLGDAADLGTLIYTGATASTNRNVTLGAGGGAVNVTTAGNVLTLAGVVGGSGSLSVLGTGGVTLSGANTFTGGTSVLGGSTLTLDYTVANSSKIGAASSLTLASGALAITPNASAATTQTVAGTVVSSGANSVTVTKNAAANNATLNLGTLSVSGGATVNFAYAGTGTGTASITTNNLNTAASILGGWATINGTDWAVNGTNTAGGTVTALASYVPTSGGSTAAATYKNQNVDVNASLAPAAAITPYTLRFNTGAAETLTLTTANNSLGSSGILVTANVGANVSTIAGGTIVGPASGDIDIQQFNTAAALTIASALGNSTSTRVVKSGPGTVNLTAAETFIGGLVVNQGGVTVTSTLKNVATNAMTINNGGTLTFGVGNSFGAYTLAQLEPVTINAGGTLTNNGSFFNSLGPLTLNGGTLTSTGGQNANYGAWGLGSNVTVTGNTTSTIAGPGTNSAVSLGEAAFTSVTFNVADGAAQTDLLVSAVLRFARDASNVSEDSSLVKTGAGTMVSSGANTFTGGVTVNAGTLQFTAANLFTGAVTVNGGLLNLGGTMAFTNGATINGGALLATSTTALQNVATNTITVNSGGSFIAGTSNLFGVNTVDPVVPLVIGAGGTVTNNGAFFSALGPVTLSGGTLTSVGGNNANFPSWGLKGLVTVNGSTTSTISASGTNSGVSLGSADISGATFNVLAGGSAVDLLISAVLSDGRNSANTAFQPSSLTKTGAGLLQLTAANTYSGVTNINAGTLALSSTGTFASTSAINVTAGALLDVSAKAGGLALGSTQTLTAGRTSGFANDVLGSLVNSGGTINPGGDGSAATLTISGGLTLQAGGQIRFDFGTDGTAGGGVNDLISLGGVLSASGVTTVLAPSSVPVSGVTYELISAGSSGTLTPANFVFGSSGTRQTYTFDTTTIPGAVLLTATGSAANLTWTGAVNGTWDLVATTNWNGAPDHTFYNLDNVTFDDTSTLGTVSIPANVQPLSIIVNNSATAYTLAGAGAITGTTGILKTGTGTLNLSGPNTFTGVVQIQQGVVSVDSVSNAGAASSLGGGSSVVLGTASTAGTLQFTPASSGNMNKNVTVQAGGGTIAVTDPAGGLTISGAVTGSGPLTKTGAGTLTLSGLNTFSGGLTIAAGTLKAGSPNALGSPAGSVTIQSGAALDVNAFVLGAVPVSVAGTGVGGGAIINSSATTDSSALRNVTLAGDTTFGGTGRWDIRGDSLTTGTSLLDLAGHTLTIATSSVIGLANATVTNGNIVINSGTLSIEQGTAITGTGSITVNAGGTLGTGRFSLITNVTRPVTLNGGALISEAANSDIASPLTLGSGTSSTISSANGFTFNISGGISGAGSVTLSTAGTGVINLTNGLATSAGNVTLSNAGTGSINVTTGTSNLVGGSFTSAANINIAGTGTVGTFTVNGPATLNGGTVIFDLSSSTAAGNDKIAIGSSLTLSGTTTVQVNVLSGGSLAPAPGAYTLIGGGTSITGGTANLALTGIPANLRQTFALDTTTTPGSVLLNVSGSIGNLTWNGPGTWDTNTTANWNNGGTADKFYTWDKVIFDDTSSNGAVSLTSTVTPTLVTVNNSATSYTISGAGGVIAGFGGLLKTGTGTLTMSNANTYTGGSVISAGTVTITAAAALGTGTTTLGDLSTGANNVALYLDGTAAVAYTGAIVVSSNGTGTATLGSRATIAATGTSNNFQNITLQRDVIFDSNANTQTVYEGIKGTGNITVTGTYRTLLLGANTFTGNITVSATSANAWLQSGSTTAGNTNFIPDTTSITVNSGARYALSSGGETIDALNGAGTVNVNGINGTLTLGGGNGSGSFSGVVANNGANTLAIVKSGTGTQTFSGTNTYSGGTQVTGGTLMANNASSSTGTGSVTIAAGASLGGNGVAGSTTAGSSFVLQSGGTLFAGQAGAQDAQVLEVRTGATLSLAGTVSLNIIGGGASGILNTQAGNNDQLIFTSSAGTGLATPDLTGGLLSINTTLPVISANWTAGSSWQLFDWSALNTSFSNLPTTGTENGNPVDLPDLSPLGLQWNWSSLYTNGTLSISQAVVIPEPSRILLLAAGLVTCFMKRRRSRWS